MSERVSGEALSQRGSLEEEIRKHAKEYMNQMQDDRTRDHVERALVEGWTPKERELIADVVLGVYAKAEATRNQKLTELFDTSELQRDIRSEEEHQEANPEIEPTASNWAIQHAKGRIYERQFLQKKFEALLSAEPTPKTEKQKP